MSTQPGAIGFVLLHLCHVDAGEQACSVTRILLSDCPYEFPDEYGGVVEFLSYFTWLSGLSDFAWNEVRAAIELAVKLLFVLAIIGCLIRLGTIRRIIHDFREARGPIWDLRNTVRELKELEPTIKGLAERVEVVRKQVAELQVESVSTRTGEPEEARVEGAQMAAPTEVAEDKNWEALRDYWRRNNDRIEYIIDQIEDGRSKLAYDRLPRTNYVRIINKLQGQKIISPAAANASRSLHELFNSYRPRNREVPDEVAHSLIVLDEQLDEYLVPYSVVSTAEEVGPEPQLPPARADPPSRRPTSSAESLPNQ